MKILFATMQFGRGYRQGTERYLSLLTSGLAGRGHESVILAGDPERRGESLPAGVEFEAAPRILAYPSRGWMAVHGISSAVLERVIRCEKPDLVHLVNPAHIGVGIGQAARRTGVPLITTVVDFWWVCPKHTLYHSSGGVCSGEVKWNECVRCIATSHESRVLRATAAMPLSTVVLPALFAVRAMSRGLPPAEWSRWRQRRSILHEALNAADGVIFLSRTAEAMLKPRLTHPQTAFIQNGLEPHWFENLSEPHTPTTGTAPNHRPLILGYAGALGRHKGVLTLVRAVRALAARGLACELRIATAGGDAEYEQAVRREAQGLNVRMMGRIAPESMPAFYDALDLVVIPSLWPENLPNVASEAYARGRAVVSSDVPGIAELVADESCRFPPGNVEALVACILAQSQRDEAELLPSIPTCEEMTARTVAFYERCREKRSRP